MALVHKQLRLAEKVASIIHLGKPQDSWIRRKTKFLEPAPIQRTRPGTFTSRIPHACLWIKVDLYFRHRSALIKKGRRQHARASDTRSTGMRMAQQMTSKSMRTCWWASSRLSSPQGSSSNSSRNLHQASAVAKQLEIRSNEPKHNHILLFLT